MRRRLFPLLRWETLWFLALLAPLASLFLNSLDATSANLEHLASTVLGEYALNTFWLAFGVGVSVAVVGTLSAGLVAFFDFPGRRRFEWMLVLPLAIPSYLLAFIYTDLLEYSGPVQSLLRDLFGWKNRLDYDFPNIRSLPGAVFVFSLALYPYVYLIARASFTEQSVNLKLAGYNLGCGLAANFWRLTVPLSKLAIFSGTLLAVTETVQDYGTVEFFAVKTFSNGVYDTWFLMDDMASSSLLSLVLLGVVTLLVLSKRCLERRRFHFVNNGRASALPRVRLTGKRAFAACLFCASLAGAGFVVPLLNLLENVVRYLGEEAVGELVGLIGNSLRLIVPATLVALLTGLAFHFRKRFQPDFWSKTVCQLSSYGYALPGTVLAVGVLACLGGLDRLASMAVAGDSPWFSFVGGVSGLIFAYVVRLFALFNLTLESAFSRLSPSMEMAGKNLGYSSSRVFFKVHLPLVKRSLVAGTLLVFVDGLKELPSALMIRPLDFETLPTAIFQFASAEDFGSASLPSLLLILVCTLPVLGLNKTLRR